MYFLWRNKPHAVLGLNDEWIPKGEIQARLDEVRIFGDAGATCSGSNTVSPVFLS